MPPYWQVPQGTRPIVSMDYPALGLSNLQPNFTNGKICYKFLSMVGQFTCRSEVRASIQGMVIKTFGASAPLAHPWCGPLSENSFYIIKHYLFFNVTSRRHWVPLNNICVSLFVFIRASHENCPDSQHMCLFLSSS